MRSPASAILGLPSKQLLCSEDARHPSAYETPETAPPTTARGELRRAPRRQLFREKGFEGTTIRDIAGAVGMQSGSPFYHFANKHELLMAVMEEGLRLGLERTRAVLDEAGLGPVERFRRLVRTHYGILHDTGSDFIPVMLYDWRSLPTQYRRRIIELKDRYDAIWQATLDELHHAGPARRRAEAGAADDPRRDQLLGHLVPLEAAQREPRRPRHPRRRDRRAGAAAGRPKERSMSTVRIDREEHVWTVTIARPEVRNAVDGPTARALVDAFRAFDADADARVAILTGAGGQFCAGADLRTAIAAVGSGGDDDALTLALDADMDADGPMGPTRLQLTQAGDRRGRRPCRRRRARARALVRPARRGGERRSSASSAAASACR